jgi:hypothetical protein
LKNLSSYWTICSLSHVLTSFSSRLAISSGSRSTQLALCVPQAIHTDLP